MSPATSMSWWVLEYDCGEAVMVQAETLAAAVRPDDLGCQPIAAYPATWAVLTSDTWDKNGVLRLSNPEIRPHRERRD